MCRPEILLALRAFNLLDGDPGGQVGDSDPDQQVVRISAAALPEPCPRTGRDDEQLARVRAAARQSRRSCSIAAAISASVAASWAWYSASCRR